MQRPLLMRRLRSTAPPWPVGVLAGVLLNCLLFAPLYLANREARLLPNRLHLAELPALLLWRRNLDPWRISVEFVLLLALLAACPPARQAWRRRAVVIGAIAFYLALFGYYLYESLARDVFGLELNAYNQLSLVRGVLQAFRGDFLSLLPANHALTALSLAATVAATALIIWLAHSFFARLERTVLPGWARHATLGAAIVVVLATGWGGAWASQPRAAISSVAIKLVQNVSDSREAARLMAHFEADELARAQAYVAAQKQGLGERPNLWLIFVESYGSVLLERPDWRRDYMTLLAELERDLADDGWHAASIASEAPTWGGGSWLSYTSLLGGLRVDSHPHYLALLNRYQAAPLPGLLTFLRGQGYRQVQLSTLAKPLGEAEWLKYTNFYGVDEWLRFDDLAYAGPLYGWGPAPPDQYALGFAAETLRAQPEAEPFVFFFITQNSHYPWSIPPLVDDWRSLNLASAELSSPSTGSGDDSSADNVDHATRRADYWLAIEYELRMLTRFIREQGTENDLFVLVGDHQPPRVSRRDDGLRTPLHILSRDPALVQQFEALGFASGLSTEGAAANLRHEEFASRLIPLLLAKSSDTAHALPAPLPPGVAQ